MLSNINETYKLMKSTFVGLQFCRGEQWSIFIRLAAIGMNGTV